MLKIWPQNDDYFNIGLRYFLDRFRPVLPAHEKYCFFIKLDIHCVVKLVNLLEDKAGSKLPYGNVVLVSSSRCMPLARYVEQVNKGRIRILDISAAGRDMRHKSITTANDSDNEKILTFREFQALQMSLHTNSWIFLNNYRKKNYYSQRASALRKLNANRMQNLLLLQDNFI